MITKNNYYSFQLGELPKGCQYCVRGQKLVVFITGLCPRKCYFCPVSDTKYHQDVTFANERKVTETADIITEAKLMRAKGAGITGGDPLAKLDRTIRCIKSLKDEFGKHFHIHLYTSLNLVNEDTLQKLFNSGLDEIRFHPDLDSDQFWKKIKLARKFPWNVGVEIPLVPNKKEEIKKLVDEVHTQIDFLNLNELEVADNEHSNLLNTKSSNSKLSNPQFKLKESDSLSYAIQDSLELGIEIMNYILEKKYTLPVHLCTAKLKDAVQLSNRIKREAKNTKHRFDQVDAEGLLTHGVLYLEDLAPGFNYHQKLQELDSAQRTAYLEKLNLISAKIKSKLRFTAEDLFLDEKKLRILLSVKNVQKNSRYFIKEGLKPAIVTEYPTADQLEIEIEFLE